MNPYKVLGVEDNASIEVCKKAYRRLISMYHPDVSTGNEVLFQEVQKAWEMVKSGSYVVLKLPKKRGLTHNELFTFSVVMSI